MTNRIDVTDRATAGGWTIPDGWSVYADMIEDDLDVAREFECYDAAQLDAWRRGDWSVVVVSVWVEDGSGREWGWGNLGGVEHGRLPVTEEDGTVTGYVDVDALEPRIGEYSVIREHDMIGEALRDAVAELERFGTPMLTEPAGVTVTGL